MKKGEMLVLNEKNMLAKVQVQYVIALCMSMCVWWMMICIHCSEVT